MLDLCFIVVRCVCFFPNGFDPYILREVSFFSFDTGRFWLGPFGALRFLLAARGAVLGHSVGTVVPTACDLLGFRAMFKSDEPGRARSEALNWPVAHGNIALRPF